VVPPLGRTLSLGRLDSMSIAARSRGRSSSWALFPFNPPSVASFHNDPASDRMSPRDFDVAEYVVQAKHVTSVSSSSDTVI
jgi:hypothetical protein